MIHIRLLQLEGHCSHFLQYNAALWIINTGVYDGQCVTPYVLYSFGRLENKKQALDSTLSSCLELLLFLNHGALPSEVGGLTLTY